MYTVVARLARVGGLLLCLSGTEVAWTASAVAHWLYIRLSSLCTNTVQSILHLRVSHDLLPAGASFIHCVCRS